MARRCEKIGRPGDSVKLIAVSKEASLSRMEEALSAGVTAFGENRVQDALIKHRAIGDRAEWHLIGHLQTNKVREAVGIFDLIHSVDSLRLAREIAPRDPRIRFTFAGRGNRWAELQKAIGPGDNNIRVRPFMEEEKLENWLAAADIHLVSLRPGWEGVVVPSKFFGSLAAGRPVLYAGPEDSAIAAWIREFDIGLVVTEEKIEEAVREILALPARPERLRSWGENAYRAYHEYFSKERVMDQWDRLLRELIAQSAKAPAQSLKPKLRATPQMDLELVRK